MGEIGEMREADDVDSHFDERYWKQVTEICSYGHHADVYARPMIELLSEYDPRNQDAHYYCNFRQSIASLMREMGFDDEDNNEDDEREERV